jgi:hypothetical protein
LWSHWLLNNVLNAVLNGVIFMNMTFFKDLFNWFTVVYLSRWWWVSTTNMEGFSVLCTMNMKFLCWILLYQFFNNIIFPQWDICLVFALISLWAKYCCMLENLLYQELLSTLNELLNVTKQPSILPAFLIGTKHVCHNLFNIWT